MKNHSIFTYFLIMFILLFIVGTKAHAASWYLDSSATGLNNGNSWENAWVSFPDIIWGAGGVVPGDTLFISGGSTSKTYFATFNNFINPGSNGTFGNVISIRTGQDSGHNGTVIIDGNNTYPTLLNLAGKQYITVDGSFNGLINMVFQNSPYSSNNMIEINNSRNVTMKYLEIMDGPNGVGGQGAEGLEISHSYFHDIRNDHLISALTNGSTQPGTDFSDKLIHDNILENRTQVKGDPYNTTCGPDSVVLSGWGSVYNNTFNVVKNATDVTACQHPDSFQCPGTLVKIKIFGNTFNSSPALNIIVENMGWATPNNLFIYNNVFNGEGTVDQSISIGLDSTAISFDNFHFDNNTLIDIPNYSGLRFGKNIATPFTNSTIKNNIFYNVGNSNWQAIYMGGFTASDADSLNIANNLVNAGSTGSAAVDRNEGSGNIHYSSSNLISTAPAFVYYTVNNANNDYHLASEDTSAIDAGSTLPFFNVDKDGISRPQGLGWDIGAYEYTGKRPKPPGNLTISVE